MKAKAKRRKPQTRAQALAAVRSLRYRAGKALRNHRPAGVILDVMQGGRLVGEELNGHPLEVGEELHVTWPDGHAELVKVALASLPDGRPGRSLAMVSYHGVATNVWLNRATHVTRVSRCTCDDGTCDVCKAKWAAAARPRKVVR